MQSQTYCRETRPSYENRARVRGWGFRSRQCDQIAPGKYICRGAIDAKLRRPPVGARALMRASAKMRLQARARRRRDDAKKKKIALTDRFREFG